MQIDPSVADKILDADFANILKKVKAGKTLTAAERAIVAAKKGGSSESVEAYATTKAELARMLGVTRQHLNKLSKDETFPKPDEAGRWQVAACIEWARSRGVKSGGDGGSANIEDQRLRNWIIKNDKLTWELGILRRDYRPVSDFQTEIAEMASECQKVLYSIPSRAPELAGLAVAEIEKRLLSWIDEVVKTLGGEKQI